MTQTANIEIESSREFLLEQSATWGYLHDLFRCPSADQWTWLHLEPAQNAWAILAQWTGLKACAALPLPCSYSEYAEEYVSIFEVGLPEPPCPLIESHWNKRDPVPKVLHENMLFYKQFGLELRSSSNETADHLRHQLEFMHQLCQMEAGAIRNARTDYVHQCAKARDDYLHRHLASWIPRAHCALEATMPDSWCTRWMCALSRCCSGFDPLE
jgi:DMSO reductase family type II enzyme chaperone